MNLKPERVSGTCGTKCVCTWPQGIKVEKSERNIHVSNQKECDFLSNPMRHTFPEPFLGSDPLLEGNEMIESDETWP